MNPLSDFEFKEMHEIIKLTDPQFSLIGNDICVKSSFENWFSYLISMGQSTVRFLPKKNNTDTESSRLVYNKFNIDNNYANKTRW